MSVKIEKGTALGTLSLTPLIDIVFLLLIFFLVATHFADEERRLNVPLADASEAQPLTVKPKEMIVNIKKDGSYYMNGTTVSYERLDVLFDKAKRDNDHQSVIVRAHEDVAHKHVVAVMNLCKKYRLNFSDATKKQ